MFKSLLLIFLLVPTFSVAATMGTECGSLYAKNSLNLESIAWHFDIGEVDDVDYAVASHICHLSKRVGVFLGLGDFEPNLDITFHDDLKSMQEAFGDDQKVAAGEVLAFFDNATKEMHLTLEEFNPETLVHEIAHAYLTEVHGPGVTTEIHEIVAERVEQTYLNGDL